MKPLHIALFFFLLSALSFNCQKEYSTTSIATTGTGNNVSSPITATLQGNILDENGQPAGGVLVTAGTKTTTTDNKGYFRIVDAALDKNASLVTADKAGYFKAYRTFNATAAVNQVVIKLLKKTLAGSVDATTGGEVTLSNGAKIVLDANSVVKADKSAYTGSIKVYASYIDPTATDIHQTIPGSFMANDKDNNRVILKSFGMMAVVLESTSGEKLQIANGHTSKLTIPIPSSLQPAARPTISLWYVDEQTGLWKEEGVATKNGTNYTGEVKHFTYWNADFSNPAVTLSMILKNSAGAPLTYAGIVITSDTGGIAHGYTDSSGKASGLVPANINLILQVADECGVIIYSQNIGPFSQNTDLGSITVGNSSSSIVTIKGTLTACNNTAVSNGYAVISYNNVVRYTGVDHSGNFSITFVTCSASQATADIFGVNIVSFEQGPIVTVPVSSPETNAGNILACGATIPEYIKFNLDGTQNNLINSSVDSLVAYTYPTPLPLYTTTVAGNQLGTYINFDFSHNQAAGIFPLNRLSISNFDNCVLVKPFNINVTNYPQNIGEFYEGNFSGQFRDSLNVTSIHNINCSFRLKKLF